MLRFRSLATMTPREAGEVVRSWALLPDSGIMGPHEVQEAHIGAGTAAIFLCQAAPAFHVPDPVRRALSQIRVQSFWPQWGCLGQSSLSL